MIIYSKTNSFEKGDINSIVLLAFAALGLIGFIIITSSATFQDDLFSLLYPKPPSYAAPVGH